ncbi:MAG: hypothetical protein WC545_03645 [Patescibacteria group bacterium]
MPQDSLNNEQYIRWQIPEYRAPKRSRSWYILAGLFVFICLFLSFFSVRNWQIEFLGPEANFLFALIIIVGAIITLINETREPLMIDIELGPEGIKVGRKFYDYDEFKNFVVLYRPKQKIKNLYLEYKNAARWRLSLRLRHLDPLAVRNFLAKYLEEDLERTAPPLSEQLTKLLKL